MPQGQRTLTEVNGVVEIGPVGPATQKEVAPVQANTSRKRDAAEAPWLRQQHSQQQPVRRAARGHATAAQGRSGRQPAATAAQQGGSSGKLGQVANINTTTPNKPGCATVGHQSGVPRLGGRRRRRRALRPTLLMQKLTRRAKASTAGGRSSWIEPYYVWALVSCAARVADRARLNSVPLVIAPDPDWPAGGFFARYGREPNGPRPTVIPPHTTVEP